MTKKLPKIISREEFEKLLAEAKKIHSKASEKRKIYVKKYMLAMMLGFESGLRISEIVGWKDRVPKLTKQNFEANSIRIISGKGGRDRITPKPKRLNQAGLKLLPIDLDRRSIQYFITELGKRVLNKDISFHTLRHGFATECLRKGMDISQVQMFMGHSRLDTTGIYLHADPSEALKKYEEVF